MRKVISEGVDDNSNKGDNIIEVSDDDISEAKEGLKDIVGSVDLKLYQINRELENVIMIGIIKDAGGIEFKLDKVKGRIFLKIFLKICSIFGGGLITFFPAKRVNFPNKINHLRRANKFNDFDNL